MVGKVVNEEVVVQIPRPEVLVRSHVIHAHAAEIRRIVADVHLFTYVEDGVRAAVPQLFSGEVDVHAVAVDCLRLADAFEQH